MSKISSTTFSDAKIFKQNQNAINLYLCACVPVYLCSCVLACTWLVYLNVCLCVCLCACVHVTCVLVCLYAYAFMFVCMCVFVPEFFFTRLLVCLCDYLRVCLCVCVLVCVCPCVLGACILACRSTRALSLQKRRRSFNWTTTMCWSSELPSELTLRFSPRLLFLSPES